ncbi:MAG: leucine-rich repeat protein, partial [Ruminococcus sp.]|nr:leucine-rich repeat protein [Ruminococcus sp.]
KRLKEIELPDSLDTLGCGEMFSLCSKLEKVKLPAQLLQIDNDSFWRCESLKTIDIPESVRKIGANAFEQTAFESITIPKNVTEIGIGAFWNCTKLKTIDVPASVKTIKYYCFYDCSGLSSVTLHEGLETIELETFIGCKKLKSITIPKSVTTIGKYAYGYYKDGQNYVKVTGAKIYGYKGSAAQKYAKKYGIKFVALKDPGDVNGDTVIDIKDVTLLKQYLAKWNVSVNQLSADVNGDGSVDIKDLTLLKQYIAKWKVELK